MAKNSTLRAIRKAGFNETAFPNLQELIMVSEPEAAAVYTARALQQSLGSSFLKVRVYFQNRDGANKSQLNECFVLCDAGGGTVVSLLSW
jgi:hypothetical protein